jgi:hypothetical protein
VLKENQHVRLFPEARRLSMDRFRWEEEKEQRQAEYLKRHEYMARLFVEDRLTFERERKRLLDEFFNGIEDEDRRRRLRTLQTSFEEKMKHAGSARNRFVLVQTFFWDHFLKTWQPCIRKMDTLLKNYAGKIADLSDPS